MSVRLRLAAFAALALFGCDDPFDATAIVGAAPAGGLMDAGDLDATIAALPAGDYSIDTAHTTVLFEADHLGFSRYVGSFAAIGGRLALDPADPARAELSVTIEVSSVVIPPPPEGFLATLLGPDWLDAGAHPRITYRSTAIEMLGPALARVTGDLAFRGVTRPVTMLVSFNGGYASHPYEPRARIGFSAAGTLSRSAFGLDAGVPPPGSNIGVADTVRFRIETELNGPMAAPS